MRQAGARASGRRREVPSWPLALALVLVAGGVTAAVQWVIGAVPLPARSNVPEAAVTWTVVGGTALLAAVVLLPRLPNWLRWSLVVATLTATATSVLAWPLHGTAYYFGGLWSDQLFRTQYLTRMTAEAALADMNYADLPPFYPAGWFWPAGRIAALTDTPGWAAYKPVALATMGATPALCWLVWSRLVGWRSAVAVALVTLLAGVSLAATEPYSWPVVALIPAAAVAFWRQVTAVRPRMAVLGAVGLFLGVAGATYTLYGVVTAVLIVVLAGGSVVVTPGQRGAAARRGAVRLALVALPALAVSLVVWLPFLVEAARSEPVGNTAARFLPLASAELPEVLTADLWGVLLTIGLGAILVRLCTPWGRRPDVLLALLVTLACAYAWYAASTLALLAGTTLLAFRLESLVVLTLGTAGVIALAELAPGASRLVAEQRWAPTRAAGTAVALTVLAVTQVATDRGDSLDERVEYAYSTPYPDGPDAMGRVDPASEEGWSDALAAEIARLSRTDPEDLVVLSTDYALLSHHPYRGFQQISPHYANPLADYDDRAAYIRRMAGATSAADLTGLLDDCPWWPPTVFVLRQEADGLHLRLGRDAFPASPNVEFTDVVFAPAVFRSAGFSTADVGPYLVAVRRS